MEHNTVTDDPLHQRLKAMEQPVSEHTLKLTESLSDKDLQAFMADDYSSLRLLLDMLGCAVVKIQFGTGLQRTVLWANDAFFHLTGATREEYDSLEHSGNPNNVLHPDDIDYVFARFKEHVHTRKPLHIQYRVHHKDGHYVWLDVKSSYIGDVDGKPVFINIMFDITAQKQAQDLSNRGLIQAALLSYACMEHIFEYDVTTDTMELIRNFEAYLEETRFIPNFTQNPDARTEMHPEDRQKFMDLLRDESVFTTKSPKSIKIRISHDMVTFEWFVVTCLGFVEESTGHRKVLGKMVNVNDAELQLQRLSHRSKTDSMTGAYNKSSMTEQSRQFMGLGIGGALVMIDIDNFKSVNDNNGHAFGDEVIVYVVKTLRECVRQDDLIGRMGGDEFSVLLTNVDGAQAKERMEEYSQAIKANLHTLSHDYPITLSIGLATFPQDAQSFNDLYQKADMALYHSKTHGKDQVITYSDLKQFEKKQQQ